MPNSPVDPADLTAALIRCPSITPEEGGALTLLADLLGSAGFDCTRVDRGGISNLYARWGPKGAARSFGFNGHTDVVPLGDEAAWSVPPFGAEIRDGMMWGRMVGTIITMLTQLGLSVFALYVVYATPVSFSSRIVETEVVAPK